MSFGSMNDGGNDTPMAEINVTPLVDVMLVLLIVFMVTMPVLTHSIPLNLPTAAEQQQEPLKDQMKEPLRRALLPMVNSTLVPTKKKKSPQMPWVNA